MKRICDCAVTAVCEAVRQHGGRALLVGGAVRDMLLGGEPKDFDIEVFGIQPDRLLALLSGRFELDLVGESFGVVKLRHHDIDIALPRRESKTGQGHRAFEVRSDPSMTVAEAAERRDFTINAIYYDPLEDRLEDPFGGIADLEGGILRHVSRKFAEDPLRVLRGMQFTARFGLVPDRGTIAICSSVTPEDLPPERIFGEWSKLLLQGRGISRGLGFLRDTGWVKYYPELERLIGCAQDPVWHPEGDVWNHTLKCLDCFAAERIGDAREDVTVGMAVLCHDFGKPATTRFEGGRLRSRGHDEAGVNPTLSFLRRMTREERLLREVPALVKAHMAPFSMWRSHAGDAAVRRLAARVVRLDRLIRVARADALGCGAGDSSGIKQQEALSWLAERAEALEVKSSVPTPILQGRHLVAMGLRPSPAFGKILSAAYEAQLDGRIDDLDSAIAFARRKTACS